MLQDTYHQLWELLRAFIDLASAAAGAHALLRWLRTMTCWLHA